MARKKGSLHAVFFLFCKKGKIFIHFARCFSYVYTHLQLCIFSVPQVLVQRSPKHKPNFLTKGSLQTSRASSISPLPMLLQFSCLPRTIGRTFLSLAPFSFSPRGAHAHGAADGLSSGSSQDLLGASPPCLVCLG